MKIDTLMGSTTSSLQKLKHAQGGKILSVCPGGRVQLTQFLDLSIFTFPTLGIRYSGKYVLKFVVYKLHGGDGIDEDSGCVSSRLISGFVAHQYISGKFRVPYIEQIAEIEGSELISKP